MAVFFTPEGYGVVTPPVLRRTGPRFENPANADGRHPVVLRPGAIVPDYVTAEPAENVSLAGLSPRGDYEFSWRPTTRSCPSIPARARW